MHNLISNYLQASGRVQLSDQIPHFQAGGDNTHPVPRVSHSLQPKVIDKVDRSVAQSVHTGLLSLGSAKLNLIVFFRNSHPDCEGSGRVSRLDHAQIAILPPNA